MLDKKWKYHVARDLYDKRQAQAVAEYMARHGITNYRAGKEIHFDKRVSKPLALLIDGFIAGLSWADYYMSEGEQYYTHIKENELLEGKKK